MNVHPLWKVSSSIPYSILTSSPKYSVTGRSTANWFIPPPPLSMSAELTTNTGGESDSLVPKYLETGKSGKCWLIFIPISHKYLAEGEFNKYFTYR
ncbi:hypothetical protein NPIL_666801 [Nephila pilipes]|uniref:Uncharacterized protein n=1 Tax=Nephila pilipes TaxID=299642 RepID=A0A8X6PDJ6_NEPPI|nr:hypothetical protein NPIL_254971 [Nephila pilipes]GFT64563.1 hypothetical protein NPIL_666801 [Nephila pilipes]